MAAETYHTTPERHTTDGRTIEQCLRQDGYAVVRALDTDAVEAMQAAYDGLSRAVLGFNSTILSRDPAYRVAVDAAIRRAVEPAIGSLVGGYRIGFCTFAVKGARSADSAVPLHQDWSFVDERHHVALGFWAPLVDVGPDNGCLQVCAGSHAFPHALRPACTPFAYAELAPYLMAECLTTVPMRAGDAMLFDTRMFHCSPPNASAEDRVAATAVLVPAGCRMRYYHALDLRHPNTVEAFDVDDAFYLHHTPGTRPADGVSLGTFELFPEKANA